MLSRWPQHRWYRGRDKAPSDATRMLTLLIRLEDTARLDAFLADIAPHGLNDKDDNAALLAALTLLPPARAAALTQRIIVGTAAEALSPCGDFLARAAAAPPDGRLAHLVGAATALVDALPGDPARAPQRHAWQRAPDVQPGFIVDLFAALASVDEALAEHAADYILAWPETYGLDGVLVPAISGLMGSVVAKRSAAVQRLRTVCIDHLRARIAEPLQAPKDWSRSSAVGCRCATAAS